MRIYSHHQTEIEVVPARWRHQVTAKKLEHDRMATQKLPADFETDTDNTPVAPEAESAKDVDGIPYCCDHHCRMQAYSGGKKGSPATYYKCPVKECDSTAKMIRTTREGIVPPVPVVCPRCSGPKKNVVCVRSQLSTASYVILACPECEWKSAAMVSPALAAQQLASRGIRSPQCTSKVKAG